MIVNKILCEKALSKTSINLADGVVNPYRGCYFGCRYCYASSLKQSQKRKLAWGSYVDVKINIAEILEKELIKNPSVSKILLGSTTEVYQPIESDFRLTRRVLEVLLRLQKKVVILTRSPLIKVDCDLLQNIQHEIFFTCTPKEIYEFLEPRGTPIERRIEAIGDLVHSGLNIVPYICPLFPDMFDLENFFVLFKKIGIRKIALENVNLKILHKRLEGAFISKIKNIYADEAGYNKYWGNILNKIKNYSEKHGIAAKFHLHDFGTYCQINYNNNELGDIKPS